MPKYKFTVTLERELTYDEFRELEQALAYQCEQIYLDEKEVVIGYIVGSERLEEI